MTDQRFEKWVAVLLRTGVLCAAAVVLTGAIGHLAKYGETQVNYRVFVPDRGGDTEWLRVVRFGLLILIATPVARVVLSIFAFALERDWVYVGIAALVLAILLYGLI